MKEPNQLDEQLNKLQIVLANHIINGNIEMKHINIEQIIEELKRGSDD